MQDPSGTVSAGKFGKLSFGPPSNPAYGASGKVGAAKVGAGKAGAAKLGAGKAGAAKLGAGKAGAAAKLGAGKVAAAGVGSKLFTGLLLLLALPIGTVLLLGAVLFSRKKDEPVRGPVRRYRRSMLHIVSKRFVIVLLALVSAGLLGIAGSVAYDRLWDHNIIIAAGASKAESFVLMQALKTVTARYYPHIKITVQETGGTTESLQRLEKKEVELATAQADVPGPPNARTVAVLFEDTFQLLVHKNSPIAHFADLKGKRIALPRTGGQYKSFLSVANHFGLKEGDFTFVGGDDEAADVAFAREEADALFRVRALHNAAIMQLVSSGTATMVSIEDGAAMHVDSPAYTPTVIPKGAFTGNPPVPAADLASVSTQRLLLARQDVDKYVIHSLTQVLIERRRELAAAIPASNIAMRPLTANISMPPSQIDSLDSPLHPGAMAFYNHDQTAFVTSHADLIALSLVGFVLIGLWVLELRRFFSQGQKHRSHLYNRQLVEIMEDAQTDGADHAALRAKLNSMMLRAIRDLDDDKMSEEAFQSFHIVWQIAMDIVREKPIVPAPIPATGVAIAAAEPSRWSLSKLLQRSN